MCTSISAISPRTPICRGLFFKPDFPAALGSTGSAAGAILALALSVGFAATMAASDFSRSCIIGDGSSSPRCGPTAVAKRSTVRPPGSRTRSLCACQVLRPRRVFGAFAVMRPSVLTSANGRASAPERGRFRGSMAGLRIPLPTLRLCPRGRPRTASGRCGSLLLHRKDLHPLLLAGLPAHSAPGQCGRSCPARSISFV